MALAALPAWSCWPLPAAEFGPRGGPKMPRSKMTLLAGMVFLCSALAYAQTSAGSLGGTITDPNGASIPDAKVVATNATTGAKQEVVSTEAGLYLFPVLPVSLYSVTVEKAGFKKLH